jgi:hypothetical protein
VRELCCRALLIHRSYEKVDSLAATQQNMPGEIFVSHFTPLDRQKRWAISSAPGHQWDVILSPSFIGTKDLSAANGNRVVLWRSQVPSRSWEAEPKPGNSVPNAR